MTARDMTFVKGAVGLGSFDDTSAGTTSCCAAIESAALRARISPTGTARNQPRVKRSATLGRSPREQPVPQGRPEISPGCSEAQPWDARPANNQSRRDGPKSAQGAAKRNPGTLAPRTTSPAGTAPNQPRVQRSATLGRWARRPQFSRACCRSRHRSSGSSNPTDKRSRLLNNAVLRAIGGVVTGVRHGRGLFDQGLDGPQADRQLEKPSSLGDPLGLLQIAPHFEAQHAAEAALHLAPRKACPG